MRELLNSAILTLNIRISKINDCVLSKQFFSKICWNLVSPAASHRCVAGWYISNKLTLPLKNIWSKAREQSLALRMCYVWTSDISLSPPASAPLQEVVAHWIAESRIAIEEIRLLILKAAHSIDTRGIDGAKKEVRPPWTTIGQALSRLSYSLGISGFMVLCGHSVLEVSM